MKYLLDTNIILAYLLGQEKAEECERLMRLLPIQDLAISVFSLHSIGVILTRRRLISVFQAWVREFVGAGVPIVAMSGMELMMVSKITERMGLDFDDAYQYIAARRHDLTIISLDGDFDRTDLGRRTPGEIIQALDAEFDVEIEDE